MDMTVDMYVFFLYQEALMNDELEKRRARRLLWGGVSGIFATCDLT